MDKEKSREVSSKYLNDVFEKKKEKKKVRKRQKKN